MIVHHKQNAIKSYALTSDCLPRELLESPCPLKSTADLNIWQLKRRIGAVGMLRNAPSDALLCTDGYKCMNAKARQAAFDALTERGELEKVEIEGIKRPMYILAEDKALLEQSALPFTGSKRVRFIAPLDCMMWDRKLILELFGFKYSWEIYTPAAKLIYAHYTLPLLYGERFAGRAEPICERKQKLLRIKRVWLEADFQPTQAFERELCTAADRLRRFNGMQQVVWGEGEGQAPSCAYAVIE